MLLFSTDSEGNTASVLFSRLGISVKRLIKPSTLAINPMDCPLTAIELANQVSASSSTPVDSAETSMNAEAQSQILLGEEKSQEPSQMPPSIDLEAWFGGEGRERVGGEGREVKWEMEWDDAVSLEKGRLSLRNEDHTADQCCEIPLFFDLDQLSNNQLLQLIQSAYLQLKTSHLPSSMQVWAEKGLAKFS
jgi:hypothetical protein